MNRLLFRNAFLSVVEALCAAASLFILFRLVILDLGVAAVGAWSLVAATLSLSTIADIGVGGSLQRFVPAALSRGQPTEAVRYVETSLVTVSALYAAISVLGWPLFGFLLASSVKGADQALVLTILPYSLVSFWLANVASVFLIGLASVQRYDLRSMTSIGGMVVQLVAAVLLIPRMGLVGLVWAQILQNLFLLAGGFITLKRKMPDLTWLPYRFSLQHFKEMIRYGVNLQLFFVANFLFEPTTKFILSNMFGLVWVGYFELGSRMARQVRNLLASASQVTVPTLAHVHESSRQEAFSIYRRASSLTWMLAWPVMATLAALTPAIGYVWLGHDDPRFVTTALILIGGWTVNLLSAPSYFMALGTGRLRWNRLGWLVLSSLNLVGGLILGMLFGGTGTVAATAIALSIGSVVTLVGNHRQFDGRASQVLNRPAVILSFLTVAACALSLGLFPAGAALFGLPVAAGFTILAMAAVTILGLMSYPDAKWLLSFARGSSTQDVS